MSVIDNRTQVHNLPLPHPDNKLEDDVQRLRDALTAIDSLLQSIEQRLSTKSEAATVSAISANLNQTINGLTERMVQVESGKVSQVNGQAGPSVQLTPAHLGMLPNQPTDGPNAGTLTRDAAGRITQIAATLEGEPCISALGYDGQGRLSTVETTYRQKRRIETLVRDAAGRITGVNAQETTI